MKPAGSKTRFGQVIIIAFSCHFQALFHNSFFYPQKRQKNRFQLGKNQIYAELYLNNSTNKKR
jgi:hypothetical protein